MQPSPTVENGSNDRTVARGETCFDEVTRAGRTVACTYPVSLAAPSARCAPVLHCSQDFAPLPFFLSFFLGFRRPNVIFDNKKSKNHFGHPTWSQYGCRKGQVHFIDRVRIYISGTKFCRFHVGLLVQNMNPQPIFSYQ